MQGDKYDRGYFGQELTPAVLIRRYKRFLADVRLVDGSEITVHCPNTGAMSGCQEAGSAVWLSHSDKPSRKYAYTWELVEAKPGVLVGIHTGRSNHLIRQALSSGLLSELQDVDAIRGEYTAPELSSRFDFRLDFADGGVCLLEVKNVTACVDGGMAFFPDAKSIRATKHARELIHAINLGYRAAMVFCVQRSDVHCVRPAWHIDPEYSQALSEAVDAGVEVYAVGCELSPELISPVRRLSVDLSP